MQEVINELSHLERKLSLLISEHRALKEKIQHLQTENAELRVSLSRKTEQLEGFQNKAKISKLVDVVQAGESDSAGLKEKLDEYIKEIDRCIAHLSN